MSAASTASRAHWVSAPFHRLVDGPGRVLARIADVRKFTLHQAGDGVLIALLPPAHERQCIGRASRAIPAPSSLSLECSPTCIKFTASFGIDFKLFIRIASVYPDRCKQSLQHSPVVARLVWVLDRS